MSPAEYSSHPIRELLERLDVLLHSTELTDPDLIASETPASAIHAVSAILSTVRVLLNRTPPQLVSSFGLSQLSSSFQAIFNELAGFQSSKNLGHIQNAKATLEQSLMPFLWTFGPVSSDAGLAPLSDVIAQFTQSTTESLQQLTGQRDKFAERTEVLSKELQEARALLSTLTDTVAKQKAEAVSVVAVVQQQYAEKEAERITSFEAMIKVLRGDFDRMQLQVKKEQGDRLTALQLSQDQAAKIVQVVGNIGVTGNYQKIANNESQQANLWRRVTIAFFCFGIVIAAATFYKFWDQPFSPENAWSVLIRLMYALAITAPAWYTARESARHRTNADRARQTELELASLGPFIELMPDDKKNQIREELTKRYFGNQITEHLVEPSANIKEIRDFVLEIVKAVRK